MVEAVWQNAALRGLVPGRAYTPDDVVRIEDALAAAGTLATRSLQTGLFPAVPAPPEASGYDHVWVRDNVYLAHAHLVRGDDQVAARTARAILLFWWTHRQRFDDIIAGTVDPNDVMLRPHVRFDGAHLREVTTERWSHAQNDALGYALWLAARLAGTGLLELDEPVAGMLGLLPRYLAAIRYWDDADSGHWEEARKRSASSIGAVLAGVEALLALGRERPSALRAAGFDMSLLETAAELERQGRATLDQILPSECVDPPSVAGAGSGVARRFDAALLFLVYPLRVVVGPRADEILADVARFLTGPFGIRRYPGDSYWAPDYDLKLPPRERTRDYSQDLAARDALLERPGEEAQWCIFDPILSALYGRRYLEHHQRADLERQVHHFERTLAQVTPDWRCPELYYMRQGAWVPGPHMPLLWTVANLSTALTALHASAGVPV